MWPTMLVWSEVATVLFIVWLGVVRGAQGLYCDPTKNLYYLPQIDKCLKCDRCLIGEEPIPIEEWNYEIRLREGPTQCRKCRRCKPGTYSQYRSFECTKCTDCSAIGKMEQRACSHTADTACADISITTQIFTRQIEKKELEVESSRDTELEDSPYLPAVIGLSAFSVLAFLLIVAILGYFIRMVNVKRNRRANTAAYNPLSTTDLGSIQTGDNIGVTDDKARSQIISETSPAKAYLKKTAGGSSRLTWCRTQQAKKGTLSETLPLLKENRSDSGRRRHYSYPSAGSYPKVNGDCVNEASTAENLDTDGGDSTSDCGESPVSSRPPFYSRQCSYPLGNNEKARKAVTDKFILEKVGEIVLRPDKTGQYEDYYGNEAPDQKSSGSNGLQVDAAKKEMSKLLYNNIQSDLPSTVLNDEHIRKFSTIIIKHDTYKDVARAMGLTENDLHEVQVDYDRVKERSLQAIYKVKQKRPNIYVKDVVNVLEQLNLMDIRDEFITIITAQSR